MAITLAGGWALLLLVWRLFDKPDVDGPGATVGIQWGIFGALLAAGALIAAGARVRAVHRPEPPNPAADEVDWVAPPAATRRAPPTGARATRPRSPTCCASGRRGRASRPRRRGVPGRRLCAEPSPGRLGTRRTGSSEPRMQRGG